jgi:hypothetical protein
VNLQLPTALILIATALSSLELPGQSAPAWIRVAESGPVARTGPAMCFDSWRNVTVLFGGQDGSSSQLNLGDTWEWDGETWHQVAGNGPGAQAFCSMTFDSHRGVTVLFGRDGRTWEFDGSTWSVVATSGPAPSYAPGMTFDSLRGVTVLAGGIFRMMSEVWEWDGSTWQLVVAATYPQSGFRFGQILAFDPVRGLSVLAGGSVTIGGNTTTYGWDGATWQLLDSIGLPWPRSTFTSLAFDDRRGLGVIYDHTSSPDATWEWDGSSWRQTNAISPNWRMGQAMAYDSARGCMVMFGGENQYGEALGDTWEWHATPLPATAAAFGHGCGGLQLVHEQNDNWIVGRTASPTIDGIPSIILGLALGHGTSQFGGLPLPIDLAPAGMPGCTLYHSAELSYLYFVPPGTTSFQAPVAVPNSVHLPGLTLYAQAFADAPGANAGRLILSNALVVTIGNV